MLLSTKLNTFKLDISGLAISYTINGVNTTIKLDSLAACDLFREVGIIEGFDIDENSEPVIYFTDDKDGKPTTGFEFWCNWIKSYPFTTRHAEVIAEYKERNTQRRKHLAIINYLLSPLQATA